jgi:hypothetical protein
MAFRWAVLILASEVFSLVGASGAPLVFSGCDLCCEAEGAIYEGGSMSGLAQSNCMIEVTKERTGRLKAYDAENSWK